MTLTSRYLTEQSKPKILLVDDKVQNLVALETLLSRLEVDTVRALSGEEALSKVMAHDFALALVDIQMPGMDGFELAELLHGNADTEHLPIIFVSAVYSGEAFQVKGVESGAIDFIEKPIVPQILIGKVKLFVELYQHRRHLLQESFRGVVGSLPDGVLLVDLSGEVLMANPAGVDMIGTEFENKIGQLMEADRLEGHFTTLELLGLDGIERAVEVKVSSLKWHGQKIWAVSMRDITRRQEALKLLEFANSELQELNEELKSFAYTVSHDLKAPLVTIGGFIGLLETQIPAENSTEAQSFIKEINNATAKMNGLLNHLLEFSRVGRIDSLRQKVSMAVVVDSCVKTFSSQLKAKQIELTVDEELPSLVGVAVRLEQLMQNLLGNAIKYMGDQPQPKIHVGIAAHEDGGRALFIRDNGSGIDPKHHEQAFKLFNRIDIKQEGSGVGLALVKKIVKMHGGKVWIESEGVGRGTTVWVLLPFADDDASGDQPGLPNEDPE